MNNNYKHSRDSDYDVFSKDKLSQVLKKKIETTMIGALSSVEENLKFLWEEKNPQSKEMHEIYQNIRSEILDKGNRQIRNVDSELANYTVTCTRHQYHFPVLKRN